MQLYPAIDLRGGKCVRLYQGDYARETVYGDDPVAQARTFAAAGAPWIHVVDLDGARTGEASNRTVIAKIAAAVDVPLQVGGGVRSRDAARALFDAGVARVVIGTAALETPSLVRALAVDHRVAVGLDVRGREIAVRGDAARLLEHPREGCASAHDGTEPVAALLRVGELLALADGGGFAGDPLESSAQQIEVARQGEVVGSAALGGHRRQAMIRRGSHDEPWHGGRRSTGQKLDRGMLFPARQQQQGGRTRRSRTEFRDPRLDNAETGLFREAGHAGPETLRYPHQDHPSSRIGHQTPKLIRRIPRERIASRFP